MMSNTKILLLSLAVMLLAATQLTTSANVEEVRHIEVLFATIS
jgi:hypothetical protein